MNWFNLLRGNALQVAGVVVTGIAFWYVYSSGFTLVKKKDYHPDLQQPPAPQQWVPAPAPTPSQPSAVTPKMTQTQWRQQFEKERLK